MPAFTVTTMNGSVITWEDGALTGPPNVLSVVASLTDGSPPLPETPTGPVATGGLSRPRYAFTAVLSACLALRLPVASVDGWTPPARPGDVDVVH